jgi:hypothetical protein
LCIRLLADLIGDGRADIVGFGDAEGALIEVASRCHVFQADGPNWRPASARGAPIPNYPTLGMRLQARGSVRFPATYGYELGAQYSRSRSFPCKAALLQLRRATTRMREMQGRHARVLLSLQNGTLQDVRPEDSLRVKGAAGLLKAEGVGFEPTERPTTFNGFRGCHGHRKVPANAQVERVGGTSEGTKPRRDRDGYIVYSWVASAVILVAIFH